MREIFLTVKAFSRIIWERIQQQACDECCKIKEVIFDFPNLEQNNFRQKVLVISDW